MIQISSERINTVNAVSASALAVSFTVKLFISFTEISRSTSIHTSTMMFANEIRNTSLYVSTFDRMTTNGLMTINGVRQYA